MINFSYLLGILKSYKKEIIASNLFATLSALFLIPIPLLIPALLDELILGKEGQVIPWLNYFVNRPEGYILAIFLIALMLHSLSTLFHLLNASYTFRLAEEIRLRVREKILKHLKNVSMREYDTLGSGAIASKLSTDIDVLVEFLSNSIGDFLMNILKLIGIGTILLFINWKLALIILLFNPLVLKLSAKLFKKVSKTMRARNQQIENFNNTLVEALELFGQIRVQNKEEHFFKKIHSEALEIKEKSYRYTIQKQQAMLFPLLFFRYSDMLLKSIALYLVLLSELSLGQMMAMISYSYLVLTPIEKLITFMQNYFDTKEAMKRLNTILKLEKEPNYPARINPFKEHKTASIELRNVSFSYGGQEIFKNLNLTIKQNEHIAIAGKTGSGKSTLANIIMGLYPISKGEIYYNGVELKQIGYRCVREHIGFVLQSPLMFNATLRYNLSLGAKYSNEALMHVLKIAQLDAFVQSLPKGLDTVIGKNGTKLSGGQKQRLSIARVLLDSPKVIIFDESTSALDSDTEKRLLDALVHYEQTVITIAHRQSTIDRADRVLFLD
jgi:ATP-binding cassette subfamily C protein